MKIHVEIWIGSRILGPGGRTFSGDDLLALIREKFGDRRRGLLTHISSYCVASAKANPGKFRYLTRVGRGLYRVYRTGDPTHSTKANAPLQPDRRDVPIEYRDLLEGVNIEGTRGQIPALGSQPDRPESAKLETEEDVEKLVLERLANAFGGSGGEMQTRIWVSSREYTVERQGKVSYKVGNTTIAHKNDLLISDEGGNPLVAIEVVFRSAVTDHFKTRSYDVIHMKKELPDLKGVVVYVKSNTGIRPELAAEISYAYDFFFSVPEADAGRVDAWSPFLKQIEGWLGE